jgi:hypothetical protein
MATDANIYLVAEGSPVTDTNSATNSAVNLLPGGTPRRGLKARVIFSAASAASGTDTVYWKLQSSATSGGTYVDVATGIKDAITLTTTAASGEIGISFFADGAQPYFKLLSIFSSNAHTDTVTYYCDIILNA